MTTQPQFPRDESKYCQGCGQLKGALCPPVGSTKCQQEEERELDPIDRHAESWAEYEDNHNHERNERR